MYESKLESERTEQAKWLESHNKWSSEMEKEVDEIHVHDPCDTPTHQGSSSLGGAPVQQQQGQPKCVDVMDGVVATAVWEAFT